jgi:hypothetical protein
MVPHSKTSLNSEFGYGGVTMLTHPMQGTVLHNSCRKRMLHFTLPYTEIFSTKSATPPPIKKIGLLLNGLSLGGILCTRFSIYIDGIVQIDRWCKQHNLELVIRCRQGQALTEILNQVIGIERASLLGAMALPMPSFVHSVDLCLMYDAPTNADIEFLRAGVPIVNPIPAPLSEDEAATANSQIVPRVSVGEALDMLEDFISDENNFHIFRNKQFADYVTLFKQSCALRRFL